MNVDLLGKKAQYEFTTVLGMKKIGNYLNLGITYEYKVEDPKNDSHIISVTFNDGKSGRAAYVPVGFYVEEKVIKEEWNSDTFRVINKRKFSFDLDSCVSFLTQLIKKYKHE